MGDKQRSWQDAPGEQSETHAFYLPPTTPEEIAQVQQQRAVSTARLKAEAELQIQFLEGRNAILTLLSLLKVYKNASTSPYATSFHDEMTKRLDLKPGNTTKDRLNNFYSYFFELNKSGITNLDYMKNMDKSRSILKLIAGIAAVFGTLATLPIGIIIVAIIHKKTGKTPLDLFKTHVEQLEQDISIVRKRKSLRFLDEAVPISDLKEELGKTSGNNKTS